MVVPFFGDQHLWGSQVARAGVGPPPVPIEALTVARLAEGLKRLKSARYKEAAARLAKQMRREDGVTGSIAAFHSHLPLQTMVCDLGLWLSPDAGPDDDDEEHEEEHEREAVEARGAVTGEGEAAEGEGGGGDGGGAAAARVAGARVAAVCYPELRLKVSADAHLLIAPRWQAENAGRALEATPHVLKRWTGVGSSKLLEREVTASP